MRLALGFVGPDRLLAGSDYPHQIGSIPLMMDAIERLAVDDEVKRKIAGENASRLLALDWVHDAGHTGVGVRFGIKAVLKYSAAGHPIRDHRQAGRVSEVILPPGLAERAGRLMPRSCECGQAL